MPLGNKITIVIPCKNEENYISYLLENLKEQNIDNTKIIIADCSTDNTRKIIEENKGELNVEIIEGGTVSIAKNNGSKLVTTPYVLFIDSDVRFFSDAVINDCVQEMENKQLDLIGLKIKCYDKNKRTQIGFILFNMINNIMKYIINKNSKYYNGN